MDGFDIEALVQETQNFTVFSLSAGFDDTPVHYLTLPHEVLNPGMKGHIARILLDAYTDGYATRDHEREMIERANDDHHS